VAFDDTLVFYTVPPDIFSLSTLEQKAETWDVYNNPPFATEGRTKDHWLNWWEDEYAASRPDRSPIWPIAIHGVEMGTMPGVCELSILTYPDITVWAFALDSQAKV
jgi:hypothetical protein